MPKMSRTMRGNEKREENVKAQEKKNEGKTNTSNRKTKFAGYAIVAKLTT